MILSFYYKDKIKGSNLFTDEKIINSVLINSVILLLCRAGLMVHHSAIVFMSLHQCHQEIPPNLLLCL